MALNISPAELGGLRRIAAYDGGQTVTAMRHTSADPVEVVPNRPVLGEHILWVLDSGEVCRLVEDPVELAGLRSSGATIIRGNLVAVPELAPPRDERRDADVPTDDLHAELYGLLAAQVPGDIPPALRDLVPMGAAGRARMREVLAELDHREA